MRLSEFDQSCKLTKDVTYEFIEDAIFFTDTQKMIKNQQQKEKGVQV